MGLVAQFGTGDRVGQTAQQYGSTPGIAHRLSGDTRESRDTAQSQTTNRKAGTCCTPNAAFAFGFAVPNQKQMTMPLCRGLACRIQGGTAAWSTIRYVSTGLRIAPYAVSVPEFA
eukprot:782968-Rhodomonas_salina.2